MKHPSNFTYFNPSPPITMLKVSRGKLWHQPINTAKGGEGENKLSKKGIKSEVFHLLLALIVGR